LNIFLDFKKWQAYHFLKSTDILKTDKALPKTGKTLLFYKSIIS